MGRTCSLHNAKLIVNEVCVSGGLKCIDTISGIISYFSLLVGAMVDLVRFGSLFVN